MFLIDDDTTQTELKSIIGGGSMSTELLLNHPVVNDSVLKELDEAIQIPRPRPKV